MNYFLVITNSKGESRIVPTDDVSDIPVQPGDDIVVMDEKGKPVEVSLRPDGEDLVVDFKDGTKAVLKGFYENEEGKEPVTINLNPTMPDGGDYEFNSQSGNLPNSDKFSLMRYSSTGYINFSQQLDDLDLGSLLEDYRSSGGSRLRTGDAGGGSLAPGASPDTASGEVGGPPIIIDLLANDSDLLGGGLEIQSIGGIDVVPGSKVTLPSGSVLTLLPSGNVRFEPGEGFDPLREGETGTETFVYSVRDAGGNIATSQVTVEVQGADDATIINPDEATTDEGASVVIDVLANDSDPDNTLTVASVEDSTLPGDASVTNNGSDVTFFPGTAFNDLAVGETEIVTFTYTTNTGSTETVAVTVTGTNDGPVAVNDADAVDEDATINVTAANGVIKGPGTDTDADTSDTLTVIAVENSNSVGALVGSPLVGTYGTLTLNEDGSYSYSADQDAADPMADGETADDVFTYTISDGNGGTETATLIITVTGTNDTPIANPPGGTPGTEPGIYDNTDTIAEDDIAPASGNVLDNDVDLDTSDVLIVSQVNGVAGNVNSAVTGGFGDITINADGTYDYFLDNGNATVQGLAVGETLIETFTYTADDQNGGTATASLTITITGTNDIPVANPVSGPGVYDDADSIIEDAFPNSTDGNVLSNDSDPDVDALTVAAVNGVAANVGSQITGAYGAVTINEDGSYSYVLDNSNPTVNALDETQSLTDTFTYTADDGNGGTATANLAITINGVDDATVINPDSAETDEDISVLIDVLANDEDLDDTLTVASVDDSTLPGDASVTNNGSDVTFFPGTAFNDLAVGETEIVTFTYTTNTGSTETVTVTVNGVNDGPTAVDDAETTDQDSVVNIDLLGVADSAAADSDPDGDELTVTTIDGTAAGGTVTLGSGALLTVKANGTVDYDPNGSFDSLNSGESTSDSFVYTISDGNGGTATATATVIISGLDDATVTNPDAEVTDEDSAVTIDVLGNDSDADASENSLTISSVTQPANSNDGTVVNNGGNLTFTPGSNFNSLDMGESATTTFTYTTDTGSTENVTVTVFGRNDAPTLTNTTTSGTVYESGLPEGTGTSPTTTTVTGTFVASDVDGDNLIIRVNGTDLGSLNGNPATIVGSILGDDLNGRLTVFGDGTWSYELIDEAEHDSDDATFIASELEQFSVTVFDGMVESAPVGLTVNIVDDEIVVGPPESGTVINSAGQTFIGSLGVTGADSDAGSLTGAIAGWDGTTTTFGATSLQSQGDTVYYFVDPTDESVLIAYTDTSGSASAYDPSNTDQTLVFTMEVDPTNDEYEFTLSQPVDTTESLLIDFSLLSAAGPQDSYRFTDGPSLLAPDDPIPPGETIIFTAYGIDPGDQVNSNASYMGLNNNLIDPSETGLVIELVEEGRAVTIDYSFNGGGANRIIDWTAYAVDNITVVATGSYDAGALTEGSFTIQYNQQILGKVEVGPSDLNTQAFRISTISISGIESDTPLDISFPVTVSDQDGDSASTTIDVTIDNPTVPPIVVDLDGDGAEFDSIGGGIAMDVDGDGELEQIAWADEDDAVLIFDQNNNNEVDGLDEFAFARYSDDPNATDLDGLRHFDSDEDLILDAKDAGFESFKLWQDRDGDGEVGEGEMFTLAEAGIDSIELTSDGIAYSAGGGDVTVHGEAVVHYSDGSIGIAADASFDFTELASEDEPLEVVSNEGKVIDVNANNDPSDQANEDVSADILAENQSSTEGGRESVESTEGGAIPATTIEDDIAANDAAMG